MQTSMSIYIQVKMKNPSHMYLECVRRQPYRFAFIFSRIATDLTVHFIPPATRMTDFCFVLRQKMVHDLAAIPETFRI